jgi:hypothetical protein
MLQVMNLVAEEKREGDAAKGYDTWYALDPAKVYPEVLKFMEEALKDPEVMKTINPLYQGQLASLSLDKLETAKSGKQGDPDRAQALDLARLIFTDMLHQANGGKPMGVHILKNEAWKL